MTVPHSIGSSPHEQALLLALELDLELPQLLLGVEAAHDREAVLGEERRRGSSKLGRGEHADLAGERAAGGGAHDVPPDGCRAAMSSVSFNWSARLPNTFARSHSPALTGS